MTPFSGDVQLPGQALGGWRLSLYSRGHPSEERSYSITVNPMQGRLLCMPDPHSELVHCFREEASLGLRKFQTPCHECL